VGDFDLGFYYRQLSAAPEFTVTKKMLQNAGIGKSYWPVSIDKIPDACAYKAQLTQMVDRLPVDVRLGKGAIIYGNHGHGKTSASAIMLKAAMARGGQCFHRIASSVEHSYEKRWVETNLDGIQVWELLTKSQLLTLDDLGQEQAAAGYKAGDTRIIEQLVRARYDCRLPTYITTNLPIQELAKQYPSIGSILFDPKRFYIFEVAGHNWRRSEQEV
jgi:DNA replication protein DnaC